MADHNFLTRAEIDLILEGMTARDLFAVVGTASMNKGAEVAGNAFEASAARQGYGDLVLDRVQPRDAVYLAGKLGELFESEDPKASGGASSRPSPETTRSPRKQ